ncbi:MAG: hypothetical protein WCR16_02640 [Bacilli bacterium]
MEYNRTKYSALIQTATNDDDISTYYIAYCDRVKDFFTYYDKMVVSVLKLKAIFSTASAVVRPNQENDRDKFNTADINYQNAVQYNTDSHDAIQEFYKYYDYPVDSELGDQIESNYGAYKARFDKLTTAQTDADALSVKIDALKAEITATGTMGKEAECITYPVFGKKGWDTKITEIQTAYEKFLKDYSIDATAEDTIGNDRDTIIKSYNDFAAIKENYEWWKTKWAEIVTAADGVKTAADELSDTAYLGYDNREALGTKYEEVSGKLTTFLANYGKYFLVDADSDAEKYRTLAIKENRWGLDDADKCGLQLPDLLGTSYQKISTADFAIQMYTYYKHVQDNGGITYDADVDDDDDNYIESLSAIWASDYTAGGAWNDTALDTAWALNSGVTADAAFIKNVLADSEHVYHKILEPLYGLPETLTYTLPYSADKTDYIEDADGTDKAVLDAIYNAKKADGHPVSTALLKSSDKTIYDGRLVEMEDLMREAYSRVSVAKLEAEYHTFYDAKSAAGATSAQLKNITDTYTTCLNAFHAYLNRTDPSFPTEFGDYASYTGSFKNCTLKKNCDGKIAGYVTTIQNSLNQG